MFYFQESRLSQRKEQRENEQPTTDVRLRGVNDFAEITLETGMNPKCGVNQSHEPPFKCVKMDAQIC